MAATITWSGAAGDGAWENASNWAGGVNPATIDDVRILATPEAFLSTNIGNIRSLLLNKDLTVQGGGYVHATVNVSIGNTAEGTLNISNGGYAGSTAGTVLGDSVAGHGIINITGLGSRYVVGTSLEVGNVGSGTVNITDNGTLTTNSVVIARNGGTGIVTVDGIGSTFTSNTVVNLGNRGQGTLSVTNGALAKSTQGTVLGELANGVAVLNVNGTGSRYESGAALEIANLGSGTLNVTDGGVVTSTSIILAKGSGNGIATVNGAGSRLTSTGNISVGRGGQGTLNINNGGYVRANVDTYLGELTSGAGELNVSGAGSLFENGRILYVGNNGNGVLHIADGGVVTSANHIYIAAENANRTGLVTVDGAGSKLSTNTNIYIGRTGQGELDITDGGFVEAQAVVIGNAASGQGVVNVNGNNSRLASGSIVYVGNNGNGELHIADGGIVTSTDHIYIAAENANRTGLVTVDGTGSELVTDKNIYVGRTGQGELAITDGGFAEALTVVIGNATSGQGVVNVDGNNSQLVSGSNVYIGNSGRGELHITDGGYAKASAVTILGETGNSVGKLTVSGTGSLYESASDMHVGRAGQGTLDITGGGVNVQLDATIGNTASGTGVVNVSGAGSVFNGGRYMYVGNNGTGTLNITNGGIVDIIDAIYLGNSNTANSKGMILVDGNNSQLKGKSLVVGGSAEGAVMVTNQGTITTSSAIIVGRYTTGNGSVIVSGAGSKIQSAGNFEIASTGTGSVQISAGGTVHTTAALSIGITAGKTGDLSISGQDSVFRSNGNVVIGRSGNGNVTLSDDGKLWAANNNLVIAENTGSTGILNIGAAGSEAAQSAGIVQSNQITFGAGTGSIVFNHTNTNYQLSSNIIGNGTLSFLSGISELAGNNSAFTGNMTVANGAFKITDTTNANSVIIGQNAGNNGAGIVDGIYGVLATGSLVVGQAGNGTLDITDGGTVTAINAITFGASGSGSGSAVVDGTGSTLTGNSITIRRGNLDVTDGGHAESVLDTVIGSETGTAGAINVSGAGSVLENGRHLYIGGNGLGTLHIADGSTVTAANAITLGGSGPGAGNAAIDGIGSKLTGYTIVITQGSLGITNGGYAQSVQNTTIGSASGITGMLSVSGTGSLHESGRHVIIGNAGNGILTLSNGGTVKANQDFRIASAATSTGVVNIGAASGQIANGAGVIDASRITFGAGTGSIVFNHTNNDYMFDPEIVGTGTLRFENGTTIINSNSTAFAGNVVVTDGILRVNGQLGAAGSVNSDVLAGALLGGTGSLGNVRIYDNGILSPGNSIGTLSVVNASFDPLSIYEVELNAAGQSDLLDASGTVTINGGTVRIIPYPDYAFDKTYTIISADGGVTGIFTGWTTNASLKAELAYTGNEVLLTLSPDIISLQGRAATFNQQSVVNAAQFIPTDNPVVKPLYEMEDTSAVRRAFDLLSGEIHASISSIQIQQTGRLRRLAVASPKGVTQGTGRIWGYFLGSNDKTKSDGNAASASLHENGIMIGVETDIGTSSYAGVAWGQSSGDMNILDRNSKADISNHHVMGYGGTVFPYGLSLRGGASWSYHTIESERNIAYTGFTDRSEAKYNASSGQVFAKLARPFDVMSAAISPYVEGAYITHRTGSFNESGAAGLQGRKMRQTLGTTTLGIETSGKIPVQQTGGLLVNAGVGWQHVIGNADVEQNMAFNMAPAQNFTVRSVPLARNAAVVNAGIGFDTGAGTLRLNYDGHLATKQKAHALTVNAVLNF